MPPTVAATDARPTAALHRLEACATEPEFLVFSTRFGLKQIDLTKKIVF